LSKPNKKPFRAADIAELIYVFILDNFSNELCYVAEVLYDSEAGQSIYLMQEPRWIDQLRCCKAPPPSRD
jgi:hypothetical protein